MSKENDKASSKNKSSTGKALEKCGNKSNSTERRRKGYEDDDYNTNFSNKHRRRSKSHIHPAEVLLKNCKRSRDIFIIFLSCNVHKHKTLNYLYNLFCAF